MALESVSWQFLICIRPPLCLATLAIALLMQRPLDKHGRVLPKDPKIWGHFFVVGLLLTATPSFLWAVALGDITSSAASMYNATIPLLTALIAGLVFKIEKLRWLNWLGILIGGFGVFLVVSPWQERGASNAASQLLAIGAVASVALAYGYQKRFLGDRGVHPTVAAFLTIFGATLISFVMSPWLLVGPIDLNPGAIIDILFLGVLVGAVGYIWNASVVDSWGPTAGSMIAYMSPPV